MQGINSFDYLAAYKIKWEVLTWREMRILGRDCPYVSWKCTASISTGTTAITASSIGMTVPMPWENNKIEHTESVRITIRIKKSI